VNAAFDLLVEYRVVGALAVLLAALASGHAILYKRDSRAAVGWVGLILMVPIAGSLLYVVFGINRIRRHAADLRSEGPRLSGSQLAVRPAREMLSEHLPAEFGYLSGLGALVDQVTRRPLTAGNAVESLINGDAAFPRMRDAISGATRTVALSTYIFNNDSSGSEFAEVLAAAQRRGVDVRVLIDGLGSRYSWPPIVRKLRRMGLVVARFMPTYVPWRAPFWNLRNHRKLLVVDGTVGFTGGMNIRRGHVHAVHPKRPVQDVHFQVRGPVVRHLAETFAEDWTFTTREHLGPEWYPEIDEAGQVVARGITDGPDEDFEQLRWTIHGAIAAARDAIHIVTPYFLPDASLITSLNVAALRGVSVQVVLPGRNNLRAVHWASRAMLWQLVKQGCEVYYSPPPFDHTKLLVIDGAWTLFGSGNWDPRSLRLNFEFNVECYDAKLAGEMERVFAGKRDAGRIVTPEELDRRPLPVKLRDGIVRLAAPYL